MLPKNSYDIRITENVIPNVPLTCYVDVDLKLNKPSFIKEEDYIITDFSPSIKYMIMTFVSVDVTKFKLVKEMVFF